MPADYVEVYLGARQNSKPDVVKYLTDDFLNDFSNLRYVTKLDQQEVGNPTIQDI